jgi:hypothetical protein
MLLSPESGLWCPCLLHAGRFPEEQVESTPWNPCLPRAGPPSPCFCSIDPGTARSGVPVMQRWGLLCPHSVSDSLHAFGATVIFILQTRNLRNREFHEFAEVTQLVDGEAKSVSDCLSIFYEVGGECQT